MNRRTQFLIIFCASLLLFFLFVGQGCNADASKIVITKKDNAAIRQILADFKAHTIKVSNSSWSRDYLKCKARGDLLAYGWKAVPYLIQQVAEQQAVDAFLGAALINDPLIKTPKQVYEFNKRRQAEVQNNTLPAIVLTLVLLQTPAGKEAPHLGQPERTSDALHLRPHDPYDWIYWWGTNKHRFSLKTKMPIPIPDPPISYKPGLTITVRNGLLDMHAVHVGYRNILKKGITEMKADVIIGNDRELGTNSSIRVKSVTIEELMQVIGEAIFDGGYTKRQDGFVLGRESPGAPRAYVNGWGIQLKKREFSVNQEIPVTILTYNEDTVVDPNDPAFPDHGSFQVSRKDGTTVMNYRPVTETPPELPLLHAGNQRRALTVMFNHKGALQPGEYNLRFQYRNKKTPSIPIKIQEGE